MPHDLVLLAALGFGLVVGSYLNVVIHRLPRGLSTVLPRSSCPACGSLVRAWDNVPLISYLILAGKCRSCGVTIAARYPLVEALVAGLFVFAAHRFERPAELFLAWGLISLLVALAGIDAEHYLLPNRLTYSGLVVGLVASPLVGWTTPLGAVAGAALGAGGLLAVIGAWYLVRRELGMGFGDVKMLAMIGAMLGWRGVIVAVFVGSLVGSVVGVGGMLVSGLGLQSRLPFGVFLSLGALVALFAGDWLVAGYASLLPL